MTRVFAIALITVSIVLLAKLVAAQNDLNTIRATIAADLPDNTMGEISPADLRGVLIDFTDIIVPISSVRGEIAPWARFSPVGTVPNNVLPPYLRTGTFQPVASWAQLLSPTGRAPLSALPTQLSYIPATDCSDGEVWVRGASTWGCGTPMGGGGGGGLTQAQVDLRIAPFARATAAGVVDAPRLATSPAAGDFLVAVSATGTDWRTIGDSDIPAGIARDTELPSATQLITATQRSTLGRFPTAACSNGQILKMSGATYVCSADNDTDTLPASWASSNFPDGDRSRQPARAVPCQRRVSRGHRINYVELAVGSGRRHPQLARPRRGSRNLGDPGIYRGGRHHPGQRHRQRSHSGLRDS